MSYTAYSGIMKPGWMTFWLVIISILVVAAIIWAYLYFSMSQNKTKKVTALVVVTNILLIALEIMFILMKVNVFI